MVRQNTLQTLRMTSLRDFSGYVNLQLSVFLCDMCVCACVFLPIFVICVNLSLCVCVYVCMRFCVSVILGKYFFIVRP